MSFLAIWFRVFAMERVYGVFAPAGGISAL